MTLEELQVALRVKVTTQEEFNRLLAQVECRSELSQVYKAYYETMRTLRIRSIFNKHAEFPWWVKRDVLREAAGVYTEPTEVVRQLRITGGMGVDFPHISLDDPSQVAYTADNRAGAEDKKLRTTLGRLLRRQFPQLTDEEVKDYEASHRGELDGTFLLASDLESVERVYRGIVGDSSCMQHEKGNWGLVKYHPSAVYTSPGLGVAYLEDSQGRVNARSVVYQNPNDPEDKRYVRIYGDSSLATRLKRQGYRCAGLAGARLLKFKDPGRNGYVLPFLDPAGGRAATGTRGVCRATTVIEVEGDDMLWLLDGVQANRLQKVTGEYMGCNVETTSGYVIPPEVKRENVYSTSALTGKEFNALEIDTVTLYTATGYVKVPVTEVAGCHQLRTVVDAEKGMEWVYFSEQDCADRRWKNEDHTKDARTLQASGIVVLEPKYYGEDQTIQTSWYGSPKDRYENLFIPSFTKIEGGYSVTFEEGLSGKKEDAICVHVEDRGYFVHNSHAKEFSKAGFLKLGRSAGFTRMAHPQADTLVKTMAGKWALRGYNDIVQTAEGWVSTGSATLLECWGETYAFPANQQAEQWQLPPNMLEEINGMFSSCFEDSAMDGVVRDHLGYHQQFDGSSHRCPGVTEQGAIFNSGLGIRTVRGLKALDAADWTTFIETLWGVRKTYAILIRKVVAAINVAAQARLDELEAQSRRAEQARREAREERAALTMPAPTTLVIQDADDQPF